MTLLRQFCADHNLDPGGDYSAIVVPLRAISECHQLASRTLSAAISDSPKQNAINIAYGNIVGRLHEQAEGMLVCIATHSYPSAEVLARVVLEGSVNLSFQVKHRLEAPLVAYFKKWLESHQRTLEAWKKHETELQDPDGTVRIIEARLEWLGQLGAFLDSLIQELNLDDGGSHNAWPGKIFKRFEDIGAKGTYFTSYHRLSSSSHVLAEDTLLYLQGLSRSDAKVLEELGVMAINYSVMMTYIATISLTQALESFIRFYQPASESRIFKALRAELEKEVDRVSIDAGCIQ